eukprot:TRINITY_DN100634_c0_g1_i1.p1 TRINITY_DN100634_c0_g1~~TRINITY_DN100634_c0_g1_i1.p1  ORF type:complete len:237 (-),score=43.33 TRINITY_DN100634_c0_g1_i1:160-870(-)
MPSSRSRAADGAAVRRRCPSRALASERPTSQPARSARHMPAQWRRGCATLAAAAGAVACLAVCLGESFVQPPGLRHQGERPPLQQDAVDLVGRRQLMAGTLFGIGAASTVGSPSSAKEITGDSICYYKCFEYCTDRLRVNNQQRQPMGPDAKIEANRQYCDRTCTAYCNQSDREKELQSSVEKGSFAGKIIMKARKKEFNQVRQNDRNIMGIDSFAGRSIIQTNDTDYKGGIRERR